MQICMHASNDYIVFGKDMEACKMKSLYKKVPVLGTKVPRRGTNVTALMSDV